MLDDQDNLAPEAERPAPRCAACGTPLIERRTDARFCSDRCRTQHRRETARQQVQEALTKLDVALHTLRDAVSALANLN